MAGPRRYQDNRTGQTHEVEWNEDREPSDREIEVLIRQAERHKKAVTDPPKPEDDRYWFNKPLSGDWFTRQAKKISDTVKDPAHSSQYGASFIPHLKDEPYFEPDSILGKAEHFVRGADKTQRDVLGGAIDFGGGMADQATAPLDIAVTAGTLGAGKLTMSGLRGLEAASRGALSAAEAVSAAKKVKTGVNIARAANAATATRGAYNVGEGVFKGDDDGTIDWTKVGLGTLEAALSAHGFSSAGKNEAQKIIQDSVEAEANKAGRSSRLRDVLREEPVRRSNQADPVWDYQRKQLPGGHARFYGNESGIVGEGEMPSIGYHEPIGPEVPDYVKLRNQQKQIGSGVRFQGFGDVIADTQNPRTTRSKAPVSTDAILAEAERRGIQPGYEPGSTLPRRSSPFSGTGSLQYDELGNVLREDKLGRRIPSKTNLPDIDVSPLRSERVTPDAPIPARTQQSVNKMADRIKKLIAGEEAANPNVGEDINPRVVNDPKASGSGSSGYDSIKPEVLKILAEQGDKKAIKELAHRRGETGSLFGGEKRPSPFISDEAKAKIRGFGSRLLEGGRRLLEDETGAIKFGDDSNKVRPGEVTGKIAPFAPKPKVTSSGGRQILDVAEDIRSVLKDGKLDDPRFDMLHREADNMIMKETDPAIIQDHFRQLDEEFNWTKLHEPNNHDAIESIGTMRDAALDKMRQSTSPLEKFAANNPGFLQDKPTTPSKIGLGQVVNHPTLGKGRTTASPQKLQTLDVQKLDQYRHNVVTRPLDPTNDAKILKEIDDEFARRRKTNMATDSPFSLGHFITDETGAIKGNNPFYKEPEAPKSTRESKLKKFGLNVAKEKPTVVNPSTANTPIADVADSALNVKRPKFEQPSTVSKIRHSLAMINDPDPAVQKIKEPYQQWVNKRNAAKGVAYNVKKDFADLDKLGTDGIHAYISGERGGRLADVAKWWDDIHQKVITAKLDKTPIKQIWDNSDEEIKDVFGTKKLHIKPGEEFKTIMDTYKEGTAKGLTPRYKTIPELMGYYSEQVDKALADKDFNEFLKTSGVERHPKVQDILKNYRNASPDPVMKAVLRGIQLTKDVAMASGLPGTAFNAHGFNMVRRSTVVNGVEGFVRSVGYMMNPGTEGSKISQGLESVLPWKSAAKVIEENRRLLPEIMEHGGVLGVEGHEFDTKLADAMLGKWGNEAANWLTDKHKGLFETHLFDHMIPALKIDYYKSTVADLVKDGINPTTARKSAAKAMNLAFAGVNYDELATNKNMLNFTRLAFLAPDWYASNIGLAKNVVKAANPFAKSTADTKIYRRIGTGMVSAYVAANIANYATTKMNSPDGKGKFMFENDPGRVMDIDTGTYTIARDGTRKKVYISPFGTAIDAVKIPIGIGNEMAKDLFTGKGSPWRAAINPVKNRLSLPAHTILNVLSGYNDTGRSFIGRDAYGNDLSTAAETEGVLKEALNPFTPAYVKGAAGFALGDMSPLEATTQAIEAPFSFSKVSVPKGGRGRPSRPSRPARR